MKVAGSTAIVTGANRGIGAAFVHCLIEAGADRVYVGSRNIEAASGLVEAHPGKAVAVELDVTDEAQVAAAASQCADTSIVINNAGIFEGQTLIGAPDMEAARREMEVNYFGVLSMCRHFAPLLAINGGGAIVNVLSAAGILAVPNMGGYCPSKFAARALTTRGAKHRGQLPDRRRGGHPHGIASPGRQGTAGNHRPGRHQGHRKRHSRNGHGPFCDQYPGGNGARPRAPGTADGGPVEGQNTVYRPMTHTGRKR